MISWRRKTGKPGGKPSEQGENQQQTQSRYGTGPESNPGQIVGGERSHYCALFPAHSDKSGHQNLSFFKEGHFETNSFDYIRSRNVPTLLVSFATTVRSVIGRSPVLHRKIPCQKIALIPISIKFVLHESDGV